MTQVAILIAVALASLLVGWDITSGWYRERIRELRAEIAERDERIANLTRDEQHA